MKFVFAAVVCFVFVHLASSSSLDEEAVDRNLESFLLKRAGKCLADGQSCTPDGDRCCSAPKSGSGCPKSGTCDNCVGEDKSCSDSEPNCCSEFICFKKRGGRGKRTCQKCATIKERCGERLRQCCSDGFCANGKCVKCIPDGENCIENSKKSGCCPGSKCMNKAGSKRYTCQVSPNSG